MWWNQFSFEWLQLPKLFLKWQAQVMVNFVVTGIQTMAW
jgi:hypothetical protein